jgi:hypothetical protein
MRNLAGSNLIEYVLSVDVGIRLVRIVPVFLKILFESVHKEADAIPAHMFTLAMEIEVLVFHVG